MVVPAKNEEAHIRSCLQSLLDQSLASESYEVIAVDGNSQDQTTSIIGEIQKTKPNLLLVENESCLTPIGMNLGIRRAQGSVIVIAGAHSTYPRHFLEKSLEYLDKTGADVVGGPIRIAASGNGVATRLTSVILSSPFGVGDSQFRTSTKSGYVDSVPFGAYKREIIGRVGLFNERLSRNQDNDLSARVRAAGGRIYLTPELTVLYHAAGSLRRLYQKAYRSSQWHFVTVQENRESMRARHFAPLVFLCVLSSLLGAGLFTSAALSVFGLIVGIYFSLGFGFALRRVAELKANGILLFPFACLAFHVAYGAGTLTGLARLRNRLVQKSAKAPDLTI